MEKEIDISHTADPHNTYFIPKHERDALISGTCKYRDFTFLNFDMQSLI